MTDDLLKVLANPTNRAILSLLGAEPTYPRRIGTLLSLSDSEVSRRLRAMEDLGLVEGEWTYIGKNVKLYALVADGIHVRFGAEGFEVAVEAAVPDGDDGEAPAAGPAAPATVLDPFEVRIPEADDFVGRDEELAALDKARGVVLVDGMPGIGKTSLLARWARDLREAGTPVFWHSFRGVESLNWLANRLGVFFSQHGDRALLEAVEAGAAEADKRELILAGLDRGGDGGGDGGDGEAAGGGTVVVLDDVDRIEDGALSDLLSDAVERTRHGRLVLASRERPRFNPGLDHVEHLHLEGLSDGDVRAFLDHAGVEVDPEVLPRLRDEVGGHPLALNLFLESVRDLGGGPDALEELLDGIPELNIEDYLLEEIVATLDEGDRHVLERASIFRTRFTADDLDVLADEPLEGPLFRLRTRRLVQVHGDHYGLHEVVRNFFYSRLDDGTRTRLHARAAAHYLRQGTIEGRLEAMHHYLEADRRGSVLDLLEEDLDLEDFDVVDAGYHTLYQEVLSSFGRDEVDDDRTWALIEDELGDIAFHRGEYEEALDRYRDAAPIFSDLEETRRIADLAWKRALALMRLGRQEAARKAVDVGLASAPDEGLERDRLDEVAAELEGGGAAE